ncbi:MAG: exonuclease SbcCD subunit D [Erysipelotrichaceae bacterium]
MKFLHLADLHLGKRLMDVDLIEDQRYVLEQAISIMTEMDCLIISGDVYDKPIAPVEAMNLFQWFITEIVKLNKQIYIVSGNHDSNKRLAYFSTLLSAKNVFISDNFAGKLQSYELTDQYGEIYIHLLPFIKPADVRNFYPDLEIKTYQQAIEAVINNSCFDKTKRNIIVAHQFITGASRSDSEEYFVGGLDNVDASCFADFDYVALGHLHNHQSVGKKTVVYAGSLLKYSFAESRQNKCFTIVEMKQKGDLLITTVPVKFIRDVREIEGYFADLIRQQPSNDYLKVTVHDEEVSVDFRSRLLMNYPNMLKMVVENSKTKEEKEILLNEIYQNKQIDELFIDFYKLQNNGQQPSNEQLQLLMEIVNELKGEQQ